MKEWPEQKSIVSFAIIGAPAGEAPAEGSHSRGCPMLPFCSNLPQARTFPVGRRWMCSGTMAQLSCGSHLPDVASAGSVAMLMGVDVPDAGSAVNLRVCDPGP